MPHRCTRHSAREFVVPTTDEVPARSALLAELQILIAVNIFPDV